MQSIRRQIPAALRTALRPATGVTASPAQASPMVAHYAAGAGKGDFSYDPPGRNHLMVPGPVNMHDRVVRAMIRSSENHRDPFFGNFITPIFDDVKYMFQTTKGTPFIFPSTGTGGWESALSNTLSPGDKVVCFRYGQFSHLWVDMAQRIGLDVTIVDERWGDGADEAKITEILKADTNKDIKAVMVVHNETTTGVTSDLAKCRAAIDAADHPALFLVDGVSSIGGLEFKFDEWGVDVAVTGSQKALSIPTGLGLVCASPKALAAYPHSKLPKIFFDWGDMMRTNAQGNFPYTPSIPLLYGMRESLAMIKEEGIENTWARHARLAAGARKAVDAWGLKLLCKDPRWASDALTVIEVPENVDSGDVVKHAYCRYNVSLGVGLSKVQGKVFRIGHLGNMNECMLLGGLAGAEMAMMDAGVAITPGSGVGAAIKHFQETASVIKSREM